MILNKGNRAKVYKLTGLLTAGFLCFLEIVKQAVIFILGG